MKLKLFQSFHEDNAPLDGDCIPMDNRGIDVKPLYENHHILSLYPILEGADYYGLTSWRMYEKTALTKKDIDDFITKNPDQNAYIYGQFGDEYALRNNLEGDTPVGLIWKRLFEKRLLKNKNITGETWINCFCNYWVADKKTWDRYMVYLNKTLQFFETDPTLKWLLANTKFLHRDRKAFPLHPFVLEYLFGLFLEDNPDIRWKRIPHKIEDMGRPRKHRAFNPTALKKSLTEIYQDHKTNDLGVGDKGTAHRYIETYDELFSYFRYKPITVLEIGVHEGHSLRMWRDYFAKATILGLDIKPPTQQVPGCEVFLCDQSSREELEAFAAGRTFDIIIDDGSHKLADQILTHECLFSKLNTEGIYVIEDIQNPETDIPAIFDKCGEGLIFDTRKKSGKSDDILLVWKNY